MHLSLHTKKESEYNGEMSSARRVKNQLEFYWNGLKWLDNMISFHFPIPQSRLWYCIGAILHEKFKIYKNLLTITITW